MRPQSPSLFKTASPGTAFAYLGFHCVVGVLGCWCFATGACLCVLDCRFTGGQPVLRRWAGGLRWPPPELDHSVHE